MALNVTKSEALLRSYAEMRELDRVAIPLIPERGILRAYQMVFDSKEGTV